ncbi:hypothetical protein P3L10_019469 [Capsicum annuum]
MDGVIVSFFPREEAESFPAAPSSSIILSLPPSRCAAAIPSTTSLLPPNAGDFNSKLSLVTSEVFTAPDFKSPKFGCRFYLLI